MKKIHIFITCFTLALVMFFSSSIPTYANAYMTLDEYLDSIGFSMDAYVGDEEHYKFAYDDSHDYTLFHRPNSSEYYLLKYYKCDLSYKKGSNSIADGIHVTFHGVSNQNAYIRVYVYINDAWQYKESIGKDTETTCNLTTTSYDDSPDFKFTTKNVSDASTNDVFFSPITNLILPNVMKEIQMKEVLATVVGLIPLALGLMVSYLGLRKGLALLQTILHRA